MTISSTKLKFYFLKIISIICACLVPLLITIWPLTTNGNFFSNYLMLFNFLQISFFKMKI